MRGVRENRRAVGSAYEDLAARYLTESGFRILARNYTVRGGELDIVAVKERVIHFIEVKYRTSDDCGDPFEAVTARKMQRITRAARVFLMKERIGENVRMSFDVIGIFGDGTIHFLENAFDAVY